MSADPSITVLISGRGSNLIALHEKAAGYRIGAVVSNRPDAPGLEWAAKQGIQTISVEREASPTLALHKQAILEAVAATKPALVVLAGFMLILQPDFVHAFPGKLLNIHPSLLPKYPGLDTHARALEAGDTEHGASVHFVGTGLDSGPLIAQAAVPVLPKDDPSSLAARTLEVEHKIYPWVVRHVAQGGIQLEGEGVVYSGGVRSEASRLGFRIAQ